MLMGFIGGAKLAWPVSVLPHLWIWDRIWWKIWWYSMDIKWLSSSWS